MDVMVDCETLGTVASSVIISIGAVRFDPNSDKLDDAGFYASISVESNLDLGRQINEATLKWWLQQPPAAQAVFHEPKCSLTDALETFRDWFLAGGDPGKTCIWSNGADFDLPLVAHAYYLHGQEPPWKFWNARCHRTMKNLKPNVPVPNTGVKHNALSDAINQAKQLQAIFKELKK